MTNNILPTIHEAHQLLKNKKLSSVELTKASLERIQQAERGERQNLSIEGARMMQDDLRELLAQIKTLEAAG